MKYFPAKSVSLLCDVVGGGQTRMSTIYLGYCCSYYISVVCEFEIIV